MQCLYAAYQVHTKLLYNSNFPTGLGEKNKMKSQCVKIRTGRFLISGTTGKTDSIWEKSVSCIDN